MCGIVAYIGKRIAQPILIEGLKRLEYRGYDSAGIAVLGENNSMHIRRSVGRISVLEETIRKEGTLPQATIGLAHTRWATHGAPTVMNAHPHTDAGGRVALVHNGIIENYLTIKKYLSERGFTFKSQTDTEVLAVLVGSIMDDMKDKVQAGESLLFKSIQAALGQVTGTFGIAAISRDEPGVLVAARRGSPLIVGVGQDEYVVASDSSAIVGHTQQVVFLNDNEIAVLTRDGFRTVTVDDHAVTPVMSQLENKLEQYELGGFPHYMLKEIFEQPEAIRNCMLGRAKVSDGEIRLGGLVNYNRDLAKARRIILTGQGTAWHAGLVGDYMLEDLAKMPAECTYASEFRYRNPIVEEGTVLIAISQSGETADTLAAVREAKLKGAMVLGVVNAVGSTIARETEAGVYLHAGPEIGVASTKAFTSQVLVLLMMTLQIARRRFMGQDQFQFLLEEMVKLPDKIGAILKGNDHIKEIALKYCKRDNWLFLGRGYHYPVALEGALKLKEISYIHAEGLPAAEMKHGPIALINEGMPVVFIATRGSQYDKVISNIQEVKARGGKVIAVVTEGDRDILHHVDETIEVPEAPEPMHPLLTVVPLQLLAYHCAVARGCNVDKPRNLAKSVTVE